MSVSINETFFIGKSGKKRKIAIFMYSGSGDPKANLKSSVNKYVGNNENLELIDAYLNNPWIRVVIEDPNDINQSVQSHIDLNK